MWPSVYNVLPDHGTSGALILPFGKIWASDILGLMLKFLLDPGQSSPVKTAL